MYLKRNALYKNIPIKNEINNTEIKYTNAFLFQLFQYVLH